MVHGVKTNSTRVLSTADSEDVLRLAREAVGRLLTEDFQRWQRLSEFDYAANGRSALGSQENLNVAVVSACR
jgi:hypothetical protein